MPRLRSKSLARGIVVLSILELSLRSAMHLGPTLWMVAEGKRGLKDLSPARTSAAPGPGCPQRAVTRRQPPASPRPLSTRCAARILRTHLPR